MRHNEISLPNCEECEQMNTVFFEQTAIFQNMKWTDYLHFGKVGFLIRYIWNREEFFSYPLKTVIFTVSKLNTQDRERNIVHLRRGSPSHLPQHQIKFPQPETYSVILCLQKNLETDHCASNYGCSPVYLEKLLTACYQFIFVTCIFMTIWYTQ